MTRGIDMWAICRSADIASRGGTARAAREAPITAARKRGVAA